MNKFLPTCEDVSHLTSRAMDERLAAWERWGLRVHLSMCALCRRSTEQMKLIHQLANEPDLAVADKPKLSSEARARFIKSISKNNE